MFSPKVLDRAHVIEFKVTWDEIANWLRRRRTERVAGTTIQSKLKNSCGYLTSHEKALLGEDHELLTEVLEDLHAALEGTRFVFAHRTARECLNFIASAKPSPRRNIVEPRNTIDLIDWPSYRRPSPSLMALPAPSAKYWKNSSRFPISTTLSSARRSSNQ
jgi:hypothetical protein